MPTSWPDCSAGTRHNYGESGEAPLHGALTTSPALRAQGHMGGQFMTGDMLLEGCATRLPHSLAHRPAWDHRRAYLPIPVRSWNHSSSLGVWVKWQFLIFIPRHHMSVRTSNIDWTT